MERHDDRQLPEPRDLDTEARGEWEDDHPYAWQADAEVADYKASLGPRGWW